MITKTLTDIEKKEEIFKDREELYSHILSIRERADYIRAVKKAPRFPFNYTTHFKSRRGNRYIIIVTPTDKKRGGLENPLFSVYTKLTAEEVDYILRYDMVYKHVIIFTPHFFSRYRERYLKAENLTAGEVIDTFTKRNFNVANSKKEGEEYIGTCKDGYIHLREKDKGVSVAVTFIGFDTLSRWKKEETGSLLEVIKRHEDYVTVNK
jgi:hypothetical protein